MRGKSKKLKKYNVNWVVIIITVEEQVAFKITQIFLCLRPRGKSIQLQ